MKTMYRTLVRAMVAVLMLGGSLQALAQERAAMESWLCNYTEGKGHADLMKVAAKWQKWAEKNNPAPYEAYVLTPVFATFEEVPQSIWIGFSPTSAEMGAVADTWMNEGGDLMGDFNDVVQCGAHTLGSSRAVRAYEKAGEAGVVQLSACSVNKGVSWAQVAAADKAFADYLTEHELPGGVYRWGAGPGTPKDSGIDFYSVWITESLEQRGAALDKWRTIESAAQDMYAIYGDDNLYTCDKPRIYYGVPVGGSQ